MEVSLKDSHEQFVHKWIETSMKAKKSDYQETELVRIFCGTWNVNNKTSEEESIASWILADGIDNAADIYAIALEEIVDLSTYNVVFDDSTSQERAKYWLQKVAAVLSSTGVKFTAVHEKHLVGMAIFVFVRESLLQAVSDVRGAVAGVGVMRMMGNKGGVAIRLNFYETSLCFIGSHFAASRGNVATRNTDFRSILDKITFSPSDIAKTKLRPWYKAEADLTKVLYPLQHDQIYWFGDFNYRIEESLSLAEIYSKIDENNIAYLLEHDQLNIERQNNRVFQV